MPLPTSHKAAVVPEPGAQHTIADRSLSPLAADEIAVKITATAINPVDWKMRDYRIFLTEYPAVIGSDAAGEVYTKVPAALAAKTPRKVNDEQASTFWVAGMAVATGLYHKTGLGLAAPWDKNGDQIGKGKTAVILGGSSSVGQYAIRLARLSGFDHIVTSSSPSHFDFLKSLGATEVLDRSEATTADKFVASLPKDSKVEWVYDTISSAQTQFLAVGILQHLQGGKVIVVMPADEKAVKLSDEEGKPEVTIVSILGLGSHPEYRYVSEPLAAHLGGEEGYVAQGKIVLNRPEVVEGGLEKVEEALKRNKEGVSGVKVVIRPNGP
ncbi:related to Zinc-binding oxidoreductase [Ustilago sp. UG-2017b]|nr:related to Zinc-binding oxidoreductase [Ustilago sp. UG-2017b]